MKKSGLIVLVTLFTFSSLLLSTTANAQENLKKSRGQTLYVSAVHNDFSSFNDNDKKVFQQIGVTRLVIRNTDLYKSISLLSVRFYEPDGTFVKDYLKTPEIISPLASVSFAASPSFTGSPLWDSNDGRPCFVVEWKADTRVSQPLVESGRVIMRSVTVSGITAWIMDAMDISQGKIIE